MPTPRLIKDKDNMAQTISYAGLTDIGQVRETNEDAFMIDPKIGLMIVADGIGGRRAGDVASTFVVENLPRQLAMGRAAGMEETRGTESLLRQSLLMVDEQLQDMKRSKSEYANMGTTVVAGLITDGALLIAHLGDSRAYRLRNNELEQLTRDHNVGNALRDQCLLPPHAEDVPEYHTLRRFIGMDSPLQPDLAEFDLKDRDRFLLCSDGLTNMLSDMDISEIMLNETSCEEICARLVSRANSAGGYDNVTVIVADIQAAKSRDKSCDEMVKKIAQLDINDFPESQVASDEITHDRSQRG